MIDFSASEIEAVRLSLRVAFWAMLGSLPVAVAISMLLARGRFWGRSLLNVLVHLPLVMPPVVTGYILLILFGRRGVLGAALADCCGIVFAFRWTGAALACAVMGFPLMVRSMRLSIDAVDRRLEDAAATLGASRAWVWLTVTLYELSAAIIGAMLVLDSPRVALTVVVPLVAALWLAALAFLVRAAAAARRGQVYAFPRWLCAPLVR